MTYTYQYPHMAVTVDVVLFDGRRGQPSILLIKRGKEPFKNQWALPGGYIDMSERVADAARRELEEETGVVEADLQFLGYFDEIDRDPRERTVSFAFYGVVKGENMSNVRAADDAADAEWFKLNELPQLAFDHGKIITEAGRAISSRE